MIKSLSTSGRTLPHRAEVGPRHNILAAFFALDLVEQTECGCIVCASFGAATLAKHFASEKMRSRQRQAEAKRLGLRDGTFGFSLCVLAIAELEERFGSLHRAFDRQRLQPERVGVLRKRRELGGKRRSRLHRCRGHGNLGLREQRQAPIRRTRRRLRRLFSESIRTFHIASEVQTVRLKSRGLGDQRRIVQIAGEAHRLIEVLGRIVQSAAEAEASAEAAQDLAKPHVRLLQVAIGSQCLFLRLDSRTVPTLVVENGADAV